MRSSLAILSLWICFNIDVTTACPEPPKVDNAQVSPAFVKTSYKGGDRVEYSCDNGYVSLRKIVFVCTENKWTKIRDVECTLKRCEQPTDIPNGQYKIQGDGKSFVVGTTIKYTCNTGFQMMSRIDTRTCRHGGWDNTLPVCEEVTCALDLPSASRIKVEGLLDYGDLMRHGHRLQFSCEQGDILRGHKEIICQSNGNWNHPIPKCEEMACLLNNTEDMKVERNLNQKGLIKPGHRIKLSCLVPGLIIKGPKVLTCQADGEWSSPFPKCEEVTCQEQELSNVQILMGRPGINPPYTSGHVLVFKCTDVNMKLYGHRAIECQSNGNWDNPYPKCQEVKCAANLTNMIVEGLYKPGDNLKVSCIQGRGLILEGKDDITCQEDGEWSSPFPKCIVKDCEPPPNMNHINADTLDMLDQRKTEYKSGEKIKYICLATYIMEGDPHLTCVQGKWEGHFTCIEPCLASQEEMFNRNIQLRRSGIERMYTPHKDHMTFVCKSGKSPKRSSVEFRQQCLYGKMTLPECE
ncbi:complement factor H isoform X2 [Paramisgurnus dabryanus]|uniref:complement factor H isoform X2 n=1 Tax=Paramisgurnus dabryanus TaxID=90735 RepID=UPI003CCF258B